MHHPGMLISLALAAVTTAAPLAPTGKWGIDYAEDMCVLSRSYGEGTNRIAVALRPYPMGTETEVVLITPGSGYSVSTGRAELTLLPTARTVQGTYVRYPVPKRSGRLARLTLGQDALKGIETSDAVVIRLGPKETYTLAIPGITAGMGALETCQADLLKTWGLDPAERAQVVTAPTGNPGALFGADSYPAEALQAGEQGRAIAIAVIDPKGAVATCTIAATSGSLILDGATCRALKRGRFSPGLDKDGKPITAHLIVPVRWSLPSP